MSIAEVRSGLAWAACATAGVLAGYGVYLAAFLVSAPFLLFAAFGAAPFIAVAVVALTFLWSRRRPCGARIWMQQRRAAFWIGAAAVVMACAVYTVVEIPQTIPFAYTLAG
ncbi:hypothetical protein BB737_14880 [Mycobacterium avium subsp. hominissuis]|uniref:Uncharacterized protein n=2 Tax=Mycobacterium TaxID=1763 RepID=A0AA37Q2J8_9MYCO|nr:MULTISPECIES: hypothetical protein [Mycobacterium]PBJ39158.1 hypothetical protein XV03_04055 [Mycobacterium avium subsp. hominissuis]PBJ65031.1 hypothetical protein BB737_14880 [Mycobacterium avium subsp. hominissuis]GLB86303.1 hypothetical protein SRL2020028_55590 [Mycobacterium kiyosense]